MGELADPGDLKSPAREGVSVQLRLPARIQGVHDDMSLRQYDTDAPDYSGVAHYPVVHLRHPSWHCGVVLPQPPIGVWRLWTYPLAILRAVSSASAIELGVLHTASADARQCSVAGGSATVCGGG